MTPVGDQETRITSAPNPWGVDTTQRGHAPDATLIRGRHGPVPRNHQEEREQSTDPERVPPTRLHGAHDVTDKMALKHRSSAAGGSGLAFKVLTVVLVCIAIGVAGVFIWQAVLQKRAQQQQEDVYLPPPNAPVPLGHDKAAAGAERLWDKDVPDAKRDKPAAARLAAEGDRAWAQGERKAAIEKYREAFAANPDPQTSLKLGELYWQDDQTDEAKNWFARHTKDAPDSRARSYISEVTGQ